MLFGPESSGKTTLAKKLSEYYQGTWVPEFAREYLQQKWDSEQKICEPQDILPIAIGQMKLENAAVKSEKKVVFCDTDDEVAKAALENTYDLYLLTYIDTPWQADDLRDRPDQREEMFAYFKHSLIKHGRPYLLVKGSLEERMQLITNHLNSLLN